VANDVVFLNATEWIANPQPDVTPPKITGGPAAVASDCSALVTWVTDEPASSRVFYGESTPPTESAPTQDQDQDQGQGLHTGHHVVLNGLDPSTLYSYFVLSADRAGNPVESGLRTFTTTAQTPVGLGTPTVDAVSHGSVTVSWSTAKEAIGTLTASAGGAPTRVEVRTEADLTTIVDRSARILGVEIAAEAAVEIARRSRGTPRIANRLLRRVRDFAEVRADGRITPPVCHDALDLLEVDAQGFDESDRRLLRTIIEKFGGGPVGLNSLAAAIGEEKDAIEDIYEPFLIQIGFLDRTPRGRVATGRAYEYFGLLSPGKDRLW
jgi:hypothetical protein